MCLKIALRAWQTSLAEGTEDAPPSMGNFFFAQFGALGSGETVARSHLEATLTLRRSASHHATLPGAYSLAGELGWGRKPHPAVAPGSSASPGGNPNPQMEA